MTNDPDRRRLFNTAMAALRRRPTLADVHMDLDRPIFDACRNRFAPNLFEDDQPSDTPDAARYPADTGIWVTER